VWTAKTLYKKIVVPQCEIHSWPLWFRDGSYIFEKFSKCQIIAQIQIIVAVKLHTLLRRRCAQFCLEPQTDQCWLGFLQRFHQAIKVNAEILPQTGFRFLSKFFRFIASPNIP
jgi:hypothetical protein